MIIIYVDLNIRLCHFNYCNMKMLLEVCMCVHRIDSVLNKRQKSVEKSSFLMALKEIAIFKYLISPEI